MQKTDAELLVEKSVIEDETAEGGNTKTRIATMFENIIDSKINNTEAAAAIEIPMDAINSHLIDLNNPHVVTKDQIGLGNVDNTADVDKPISNATQIALESTNIVLVSGAVTLDSTAFGKIHSCSGTSANYTITLPTAVGSAGKMIAFKGEKVSALNKAITLDGSGSELIDGVLTRIFSTGGYVTLVAREIAGTGSWDILSFEQGGFVAWTPTFTGFSGTPTGNFFYRISGKTLFLRMEVDNTTSSGTTVTFTLPESLTCAGYCSVPQVTNAGTQLTTQGKLACNSTNTVQVFPNSNGGWTASSTRGFIGFFTLQIL